MPWFDFITGTKRPEPGLPRLPATVLRARLLALNRPDLPWRIVDGADRQVDLVCEWRMDGSKPGTQPVRRGGVSAAGGTERLEFGPPANALRGGRSSSRRLLLKFNAARGEVRNVERDFASEWGRDGLRWHASARWFRGQTWSWGGGGSYSSGDRKWRREDNRRGAQDCKALIGRTVTEAGWTYRCIVFGRL